MGEPKTRSTACIGEANHAAEADGLQVQGWKRGTPGNEVLREFSHWLAPPGAPKWALPREAERKGAPLPDAGVAGGVAAGVAKGVPAWAGQTFLI